MIKKVSVVNVPNLPNGTMVIDFLTEPMTKQELIEGTKKAIEVAAKLYVRKNYQKILDAINVNEVATMIAAEVAKKIAEGLVNK